VLHSSLVSKWFNLDRPKKKRPPQISKLNLPDLLPGQIILITGPSGSGKSTLLRRLRRRRRIPAINIPRIALSYRAVIDHFPHISVESALAHLSRVGLAEAHCYLLPPRHLSDGQRWRLRLALALSRDSDGFGCLIADEFTSLLDTLSASVVSRVLRRAITEDFNRCAILACSRTDILRALGPNLIIRCDFGKLEVWRKAKGENYVLEGETSQSTKLHSRPPRSQKRHAGRLQSP
jgi:ABC-type ATPase with predicted acetyltransferase domain